MLLHKSGSFPDLLAYRKDLEGLQGSGVQGDGLAVAGRCRRIGSFYTNTERSCQVRTSGGSNSSGREIPAVSPRCVICSGICTGICSAATELGAGLPLLSSSRVSRIWREEGLPGPEAVCEDIITSWRALSRTEPQERTFVGTIVSSAACVCVCVCVYH